MTKGARLRIRVLGPICVTDDLGRDLTPSGGLQRRLLAWLVLHRGRVVGLDAAVEVLWPDGAVDHVGALHSQVSRLRRALGDGVIVSAAQGYTLDPRAVLVDADELADAVAQAAGGRAGLPASAALRDAWHGPGYPELADTDEGRAEAARLEELRARASELDAAARLAVGQREGLAAELRRLVDAYPFRERPRVLLMQCLAAEGRTADALRVYDDFRRLLAAELGVEPSPELLAAHAALLVESAPVAWRPATRLPAPTTSLVGRDALVAEVVERAGRSRLVTLVGPGGVGKTRVSVEAAHVLRSLRPDRPLVFCELATCEPETVEDALAYAFSVDARPGESMVDRLEAIIGDTEVGLVLDNCEHVVDPVAHLAARLLAGCPRMSVLATSRERLRVPGEQVVMVPTLPADGEDAPAVQLFRERARAVNAGFDAEDLGTVTDIVRRLDGLPLAIELAAARLHTHELAEVASGLEDRFAFLSAGYRAEERHASLGAAIAWSYGLLDPALQDVFTALSVFASPFGPPDAAAVALVEPHAVEGALTALVERSLVQRVPGRGYLLLETLREFGADQLLATGRHHEVAERHAYHQVGRAARARHRAHQAGRPVFVEVDAAIPDLRNALAWLLDHGRVEAAGHLMVSLIEYGLLRLRPDVMAWSERVLAADPDDRSPWAAQLWAMRSYSAWMQGRMAEIEEYAARAVRLAGNTLMPEVAMMRGNVSLFRGALDDAAEWYRRAIAAAPTGSGIRMVSSATLLLALGYLGDPAAPGLAEDLLAGAGTAATPHAAYTWYCAGEVVMAVDPELARARLTRALELAEVARASFVTGVAGSSRASLDARWGDPRAAAAAYVGLIAHWRRAGMWSTQWTMLRSIAGLLVRLGRDADAAVLEGAVRSSSGGHALFGADEEALARVGGQLRDALGGPAYEAARRQGASLDWDGAVDHALAALVRGGASSADPNLPS